MSAQPSDLWINDDGRPFFRHRPKLVGQAITFTLEKDALAWSDGKVEGRMQLDRIEIVHIRYRPANLATQRFRVEIRDVSGKAVWFANLSYRGLMDVETHDGAFVAFVRRLLTAVQKASPHARFIGGEPAWRYGLVSVTSVLLVIAALVVGRAALTSLSWPLAGAVLVVGAYMVWQMAEWLRRNRPSVIDPDNPPTLLLPSGVTPPPA
jgi:hypothetical protein